MGSMNANEVLDSLINELASGGNIHFPSKIKKRSTSTSSSNGPIIADVTDELQCASSTEEPLVNTSYADDNTIFMAPQADLNHQQSSFSLQNKVYNQQPSPSLQTLIARKNKNYYGASPASTVLLPNMSTTTRPTSHFSLSHPTGYNIKVLHFQP